jgi:hypothetical protein
MVDLRSITGLCDENVVGLYVIMDILDFGVMVHVFQPLHHIYGELHPGKPGEEDRESGCLADPHAIPKARSLDVFIDQICIFSLAAASQEIHYAGVVRITDFLES